MSIASVSAPPGNTRGARHLISLAVVAAALIAYGAIFFTATQIALTNGVCCADDAAMATVAKNLASGRGFAVSNSFYGGLGTRPFGAVISTGPTVLIPAALLISLTGNTPWAPGISVVLQIAVLIIILTAIHLRGGSVPFAAGYLLAFGLLAFILTQPWFVVWFALLGEMPAALLAVIGGTLWLRRPWSPRIVALASLCFGLAFMAKYLSLLGAVPMAFALLFNALFGRQERRQRIILLLSGAGAFLAPFLLMEIWKLAALGPSGYVSQWQDLLDFIRQNGVAGRDAPSLLERIEAKLDVFSDSFHLRAPVVIATLLGAGIIAWRSPKAWRIYLYFTAAALLHWIWWLALSPPGWPRYLVIGLVCESAALSSLAYAVQETRLALPAAAMGAFLLCPHPGQVIAPITSAVTTSLNHGFQETPRLAHLRQLASVLAAIPGKPIFIYPFWSGIVGIEYALPRAGDFIRADFVPIGSKEDRPLYLIEDTDWTTGAQAPPAWIGLEDWRAFCREVVFDGPPYIVSRCPPIAVPPSLQALADSAQKSGFLELRLRNGGAVELLAITSAWIIVPVDPARPTSITVKYGVEDSAWQPQGFAGACFVMSGLDRSSARSELAKECFDPSEGRDHERTIAIPPGSTGILLSTMPSSGSVLGYVHWSAVTTGSDR